MEDGACDPHVEQKDNLIIEFKYTNTAYRLNRLSTFRVKRVYYRLFPVFSCIFS